MQYTSVRVSEETKQKIEYFKNQYSKKTHDDLITFVLTYLEKQKIDLNTEFSNNYYNSLKNFDNKLLENNKNNERIIKILRRFEKDYFVKIESDFDNSDNYFDNEKLEKCKNFLLKILNNSTPKYSEFDKKNFFKLEIMEEEFEEINNYVRQL